MDHSQSFPDPTERDGSPTGGVTTVRQNIPPAVQVEHVSHSHRGDQGLRAALNEVERENVQLRHDLDFERQMNLIYQQDASLHQREREKMATLLRGHYKVDRFYSRKQEDELQLEQDQNGKRRDPGEINQTLEGLGDQLDECLTAAKGDMIHSTGVGFPQTNNESVDATSQMQDDMEWESQFPTADTMPTAQKPVNFDPTLPTSNSFTYQKGPDVFMAADTTVADPHTLTYGGNAVSGIPPELADFIPADSPLSNCLNAPGMPPTARPSDIMVEMPNTPTSANSRDHEVTGRSWKPGPPIASVQDAIPLANDNKLWFMNGTDSVHPSIPSGNEIDEAIQLIAKYFGKVAYTGSRTGYGCIYQRIIKRKTTFEDGDGDGKFACVDCAKRGSLCIRKGMGGFQVRSLFEKGQMWKESVL
ncbi:hypothetical protein P154DRAFT_612136 [Amniculicola lignicola CBS 123094]|uniref:Uncharacterized protein n=1 Tax=Amniculicola lignicola CBS 123094 TaxID=1392246 RepID=A0A6A5VZV3_9PLEO|nr:hypothetical protein P154DRAFT_612136 [Amniculicola lignicola CBS 123094]